MFFGIVDECLLILLPKTPFLLGGERLIKAYRMSDESRMEAEVILEEAVKIPSVCHFMIFTFLCLSSLSSLVIWYRFQNSLLFFTVLPVIGLVWHEKPPNFPIFDYCQMTPALPIQYI